MLYASMQTAARIVRPCQENREYDGDETGGSSESEPASAGIHTGNLKRDMSAWWFFGIQRFS